MILTQLEQIKMLLGITGTDKDALLGYLIDSVNTEIKAYCRIPVIPDGLLPVINDFVVDRYRARGYGKEVAPKTVSSVSEGDVTVQYKTTQYNVTSELTDTEKQRLVPYRRLWY